MIENNDVIVNGISGKLNNSRKPKRLNNTASQAICYTWTQLRLFDDVIDNCFQEHKSCQNDRVQMLSKLFSA